MKNGWKRREKWMEKKGKKVQLNTEKQWKGERKQKREGVDRKERKRGKGTRN